MALPKATPRNKAVGAVASATLLELLVVSLGRGPSDPVVVLSFTDDTIASPLPGPTVIVSDPEPAPPVEAPVGRSVPEPGPAVGLKVASGRPVPPAIPFTSDIAVPDRLVFVLVLGSDARPNEALDATRADSVHLVAVDPVTRQGTIVGIPRDSYVQFPRGGRGKINDALARGGPKYAAETVRLLTGLPVDYYLLTGFEGLQKMVDELGGVDVFVDRRMNDRFSGARFEKGWHRMNGGEALAFSRNRNDVVDGDFTRSAHHGELMLSGLGKLRSEVGDDVGLLRWVDVLRRHTRIDVPFDRLPQLAALARRTDPAGLKNVVLPGRIGFAGRASVVYLTQDAPRLFNDLRDDAVIGGPVASTTTSDPTTMTTTAPPAPTLTTSTTSTTTSSAVPSPPPPSPGSTTTTTSTPTSTTMPPSPLDDL